MAEARRPNLSTLERRITALAREFGLPPGRVRRYIGVVVVGQALTREELANVKGGSGFEARRGTRRARLSNDVDVTSVLASDEFARRFARALREGWGGFTGILGEGRVIAIPAPAEYQPVRYLVKLSYAGRPYTTLAIEVSADEVGSGYAIDEVAPVDADSWFARLGLPTPAPIPVLPLDHQIAQKLHACSTPDSDGWTNDRAHDLVDLQFARAGYLGALPELRVLAEQLFAYRKRHAWPPLVTVRPGWDELYTAASFGLGVLDTVDEAVTWVNAWIQNIAVAT